ncbi:MAG: hypothetical protein ABIR70_00130 [Bryobacteraceae bacterium]
MALGQKQSTIDCADGNEKALSFMKKVGGILERDKLTRNAVGRQKAALIPK